LKAIWEFVKTYLAPILGNTLKIALEAVATVVTILINGFSQLAQFIGDAYSAIVAFVNFVKNNPLVSGIGGVISNVFGGARATGGPVSSGKSYLVGERGPELFVPSGSGNIVPNSAMGGGTVINLTVNGAIDAEGTARTIVDVLNRSNARGALGANRLVFTT
jgi:phage-related minor tail protein